MDSVAHPACCWRIVARHFARHCCAPLLLAPSPLRFPAPPVVLAWCAPWPNSVVGRLVARQGLGGGGRPTLALVPPPGSFPTGGADACTPRQGVTLLYGPSICTRSVQMDLRRIQVRRPFPTPGSGTLWVSGESLRDRHVSCLPRWTVCPTRSPQRTRTAVRAVGSALGQAHWPAPQAGATSGRWPTVPGVTHLIARAQMGPIRTPGGPPNPRGRVPHQHCSRALVTPPPPRWSLPPSFHHQGRCPAPLAVPPGSRQVPSAPAACPCSGVLESLVVRFVFFFYAPPPMSSRCLLAVLALFAAGRRRRGRGGGGLSRCPPFCASTSEAWRRHEARHLSLRWGGGLRYGSRRHPTLPAVAPPAVPPWGLARRVPPLGTVVSSLCLPTLPRCPRGGVRRPLPSSLLPPRLLPVALASALGGCGRWGRGGGRPRCPSSGVSTSQARHWHVARHLSSCWGVGHAAWPLSSPCPRCVRSPGAPPRWRGGAAARPSLPATPTLGGAEACWGGGLVVFLPLPSRRRHEAWLPSLCRGGGFASRLPSSPLLSYARTPGGPPAGACTARALYGHGRVARPAPSYLCLPTLPRCPRGGGGRFSPPPYPHSPSGGRWCWGGGGALFASPPWHALRRHVVGTTQPRARHLAAAGGGVSLWAFPPCSMV